MGIDLSRHLRKVFRTENDVRVREVIQGIEEIARATLPATGAPGAPGTVPLIPSAKDLTFVTVTTTSHTAGVEDVILVDDDTAGGDVTIDLQAVADTFKYPRVIKKLGTTGNVIIDGDGTETIDGALTATLTVQYEALMLIPDGSNWHII